MSQAQIITLNRQVDSGQMETDAAYILDYIKNSQGVVIPNLKSHFTMAVSTIVARLSGLEDLGVIYKHGTRDLVDPSGKIRTFSVYHYEPAVFIQERNREKVKIVKMKKAAKSLYNRFQDQLSVELKEELIKII